MPVNQLGFNLNVMGLCAYNVYTSALVMLLSDMCDQFNYADDNTACCHCACAAKLI